MVQSVQGATTVAPVTTVSPPPQSQPVRQTGGQYLRQAFDGFRSTGTFAGLPPSAPSAIISQLDTSQDGGVSLEEFSANASVAKLTPERQAAFFSRLDPNDDGRITETELTEAGFTTRTMPDAARPFVASLDTNGSRGLTPAEFQVGAPNLFSQIDPARLQSGFTTADRDGNGELSATEMKGAWVAFGLRNPGFDSPRFNGPEPLPTV